MVETFNRTLENQLAIFIEKHQQDWDSYDIRSAEILEKLGWLTLEHRWHLNKALLMYKIANNDAPMYLTSQFSKRSQMHDYNVRGSQVNFSLPKPSTNFMKNSLAYSGAVTWNSLSTR